MEYTIYGISNHTCNGDAASSINTGLRLCSSKFTDNWKIEFDFTTQTISANQQSYIRCRHETSPYPGVGLRSSSANGPTQIQIDGNSTTVATGNNKQCTGSITRSGSTITIVFNGTTFSKTFTNHESPLTFGGELENSNTGAWKSGRYSKIVINSITVIQYSAYSISLEAFMWSRRIAAICADKYIVFADPVVEQICTTNWGDGIGLRSGQAARVTSIGTVFNGNADIVSFDELRYFSGITSNINDLFNGCVLLESVTLPPHFPARAQRILNGCSSLETLTVVDVPRHTDYVFWADAFKGCINLTSLNVPSLDIWFKFKLAGGTYSTLSITPFSQSHEGHLFIDGIEVFDIVVPNSITAISEVACFYFTAIRSIILPNGITSIGAGAFYGCASLTSVSFPVSGLTSIGNDAFHGCTSLTSIVFPNDVSTINTSTCQGCSALTEITLPASVTKINTAAFNDCPSLTTITINSPIYMLRCFSGDSNIRRINVPNAETWCRCSVSEYVNPPGYVSSEVHLYANDVEITTINIPNDVTTIYAGIFRNFKGITAVNFPSSVTTIQNYAFENCTALTGTLTIPSSVTSIGVSAFAGCNSVVNAVVPAVWAQRVYNGFGNSTGTFILNGNLTTNQRENTLRFKNIIFNGNVDISASGNSMFLSDNNAMVSVRFLGNLVANQSSAGIYHTYGSKTLEFMEVIGSMTNAKLLYGTGGEVKTGAIIHLGYNGVVATPTQVISTNSAYISKIYVGDGSSQAADQSVLDLYLADADWAQYSSKLDLWYNYNGDYKTLPTIPT